MGLPYCFLCRQSKVKCHSVPSSIKKRKAWAASLALLELPDKARIFSDHFR